MCLPAARVKRANSGGRKASLMVEPSGELRGESRHHTLLIHANRNDEPVVMRFGFKPTTTRLLSLSLKQIGRRAVGALRIVIECVF